MAIFPHQLSSESPKEFTFTVYSNQNLHGSDPAAMAGTAGHMDEDVGVLNNAEGARKRNPDCDGTLVQKRGVVGGKEDEGIYVSRRSNVYAVRKKVLKAVSHEVRG